MIQLAPNFSWSDQGSARETVPDYVPDSSVDVFTGDCWLEEITLTSESAGELSSEIGGPINVWVMDRQASPRSILAGVPIQAGETYTIRFGARYCPGGVSWYASVGGAIVGYMRARK